jgi:hypothetical protein
MPKGRESGLVALSSVHDLLVVWFIHEQCCLVLDHVICCPVMQLNYGHQISEVQRLQRFVLLLELFGSSKKIL